MMVPRELILVIIHLVPRVTFADCPEDLTGPNCKYTCHCTNKDCLDSGECMDGTRCEPPYYGLACQYRNIAYNASNTYLDGDDKTCSPLVAELSIKLSLNVSLTTFRLVGKRADELSQMELRLDSRHSCGVGRIVIDNITLEGFCNEPFTAQWVSLVPSALGVTLCDVYISGGRDITHDIANVIPSEGDSPEYRYIIDGNISTCYTRVLKSTLLYIVFLDPHEVLAVRFHSDKSDVVWSEMILTAANGDGNTVATRQLNNYLMNDDMWTFNPPNTVQHFEIEIKNPHRRSIFSLCEFQVFGECKAGSFGLGCNETCLNNCQSRMCHKSYGYCHGCVKLHFGEFCKKECSKHCAWEECDTSDGSCVHGCKAGYFGRNCSQVCPLGMWGLNCSESCHDKCAESVCDTATGKCSRRCAAGYTDFPKCTLVKTCLPGYVGRNCKSPCHCLDNMCDSKGACLNGSRCVEPWFYHSCQYYAVKANLSSESQTLTDHDDTTCFSPRNQWVALNLREPVAFTWLLVVFQKNVPNVTLYLHLVNTKMASRCEPQRTVEHVRNTLEIYCRSSQIIDSINFTWDGSPSICSVYINRGRSLASISEITLPQQSVIDKKLGKHLLSLVDESGDVQECLNLSSKNTSSIILSLSEPRLITQVSIRRTLEKQTSDFLFDIQLYDDQNSLLYDGSSEDLFNSQIFIPNEIHDDIKHVRLEVTSGSISLCHIHVFGECLPPYYGLECDETCLLSCQNDKCNFDGSCYECRGERSGRFCQDAAEDHEPEDDDMKEFGSESISGSRRMDDRSRSLPLSVVLIPIFVSLCVTFIWMIRRSDSELYRNKMQSKHRPKIEGTAIALKNLAEIPHTSDVKEVQKLDDDISVSVGSLEKSRDTESEYETSERFTH